MKQQVKQQCTSDHDVIRYYQGFSGYQHPIRLTDEISHAQLIDSESYLKAVYCGGKLVRVEKFIDNQLFFKYEYEYEKTALIRAYLTNADGEQKIVSF